MKQLARFVPVLVVVLLVLSLPLTAFAQEGGNPLCNGISESECAQLLAAFGTISTVESFTVPAWDVSLNLDMEGEAIALSASGSAGVVLTKNAADLVVHLVVDNLSFTPQEGELPSSLEVLINQGYGYVNWNGQWFGEQLSAEDLAEFEGLFGQAEAAGAEMDLAALGIDLTGAVTTTRSADVDMHGESVAPYAMELDIPGLLIAVLSSPLVGQLMGSEMGMGEMTPEDMQMLGMILTPMLGESALGAGVWVGNSDGYIHKLALDLVVDVDLAMFSPETPPILGELHFSAEVSNVGEGYSVEPPAEYGTMEELEALTGELSLEDATGGLF